MEILERLEQYFKTIDREDAKRFLAKGITDDQIDRNKYQVALIYMTATDPEVDMSFVKRANFEIYKDHERGENEANYRFWQSKLNLTLFLEMKVERIKFQEDYIDWGTLTRRKDLTIEVVNAFRANIDLTKITVDFGKEFLNKNLVKLGRNALRYKLSRKNADAMIIDQGFTVFDFRETKLFDEKFVMKYISTIKSDDAGRLESAIRNLEFSYEEMISILNSMEKKLEDSDGWNDLILAMLSKEYLSLGQKKDIKFRCHIYSCNSSYY